MDSPLLSRIRDRLGPLRTRLLEHPVYERIDRIEDLRIFMEDHVFAVWDFMSLLKALQRRICCVEVPWTPGANQAACRMVNEIVLGEESDEDGHGGFASHFDLYRRAMGRCGADRRAIDGFVEEIRSGRRLDRALARAEVRGPVRRFVAETFAVIEGGDLGALAAAFSFGREELLPDVFGRIVAALNVESDGELDDFLYYLNRHIELDGGEHGPMAERLVVDLCGDDDRRGRAAEEAACRSLEARIALWDGICARLDDAAGRAPGTGR